MKKDNDYTTLSIDELRQIMKKIKRQIVYGELSYDEAKIKAQPIMDAINIHMMDLCFELNRKIKTISFYEIIKHSPLD